MISLKLKELIKDPVNLFFLLFFCISIVSYSPDTSKDFDDVLPIIVPYITVSSQVLFYVFFIGFILLFIYGIIFNRFRTDAFFTFLLTRILLFAPIQLVILNVMGKGISEGNYFIFLLELFLYLGCISSFKDKSIQGYISLIRLVSFIISLEVIYQAIFGVMTIIPYINLSYKNNLVIPVGATNTLSAILLPILVAEFISPMKNRKIRIVYLLVCTTAILLTKSRFAILLMLVSFIYIYLKNKKGVIPYTLFTIVFIVLLYFLIINWDFVSIIMSGFSSEMNGSKMDSITSGRASGYSYYWDAFLRHPIIGNGPNYKESRAHNIILDTLFQLGIIGFLLFIGSIISTFRFRRKLRIVPEYSYFSAIVIISLIQSLGEITFFTNLTCDLIFFPSVAILNLFVRNFRRSNSIREFSNN